MRHDIVMKPTEEKVLVRSPRIPAQIFPRPWRVKLLIYVRKLSALFCKCCVCCYTGCTLDSALNENVSMGFCVLVVDRAHLPIAVCRTPSMAEWQSVILSSTRCSIGLLIKHLVYSGRSLLWACNITSENKPHKLAAEVEIQYLVHGRWITTKVFRLPLTVSARAVFFPVAGIQAERHPKRGLAASGTIHTMIFSPLHGLRAELRWSNMQWWNMCITVHLNGSQDTSAMHYLPSGVWDYSFLSTVQSN